MLGRESSVELGVAGNNSCYREWPLKSICKRLFYDTGIVGGGGGGGSSSAYRGLQGRME